MLKLGLNIKKVVFLSCFVEGKFKSLVKCWLEAVRRIYIGLYTKGAQLEPFQGGGRKRGTQVTTRVSEGMKER